MKKNFCLNIRDGEKRLRERIFQIYDKTKKISEEIKNFFTMVFIELAKLVVEKENTLKSRYQNFAK